MLKKLGCSQNELQHTQAMYMVSEVAYRYDHLMGNFAACL